MSSDELLKTRILPLNKNKGSGSCVLYVMSRDQRVQDNHALIAAQKHAVAKNLPLAVVFCLYDKAGVRAREHFEFMIDGLKQVENELMKLNIPFIMLIGSPIERLGATFHHLQPDTVYFDFNSLNGPRMLQEKLAKTFDIAMYTVDTHNIVPVWVASDKKEVAAYTLRPKLHKIVETFLLEPEKVTIHPINWPGEVKSIDSLNKLINATLENIKLSGIKISIESGKNAAHQKLNKFIEQNLNTYALERNDPVINNQSNFSPYLHYGQISSLRIALELRNKALKMDSDMHIINSPKMPKETGNKTLDGINVLLEEMIVRKELADNFCYYDKNYNSLLSAPNWAIQSLEKHKTDPREFIYSLTELESSSTHDQAWNAAQKQLTTSGKMHGYMRMYWAKKVLEWTESPEQAIEYLVYLNDHYSIDGGDANGYAGIMWSVAGVHDRPWIERDVFGVVRYMNYAGLKRKFNIDNYERQYLNKN